MIVYARLCRDGFSSGSVLRNSAGRNYHKLRHLSFLTNRHPPKHGLKTKSSAKNSQMRIAQSSGKLSNTSSGTHCIISLFASLKHIRFLLPRMTKMKKTNNILQQELAFYCDAFSLSAALNLKNESLPLVKKRFICTFQLNEINGQFEISFRLEFAFLPDFRRQTETV